ncbi:peroxiredoxin, Ohr subfamily [Fictibacillus enclensis]|uniref:Organic hydroperoxide resistance protein n=1 Tax=Fictibacillus enclensis TaxID=1017270 RepID=A0A0V8JAY0_9BACL|nr:organic hydroperoxide resistance protein [Fictibacillus enclensis]KSU84306.1 organic hydroperoxide resistance protein [Fictibacillus enclensis]SCB76906.1 peroxiredoxin, Ohr subfamily [Fictibacillus enclensis]
MLDALYTAKATANGGRQGKVKSSDSTIDFSLSMPKSLGGKEEAGATNPEQLFAAGYAACFDSALQLVARQARKRIESSVTAEVSIGKDTDGGFGLAVALHAKVNGTSQEEAEQLIEQAHQVCPYSKATRGNIAVTLHVSAE